MSKSSQAFRTIREVADWLGVAAHVLRFWESKFPQIKPVKRAGGRRYYRPADMELVGGIKVLLHDRGLTIRGVQKMMREEGVAAIAALSPPIDLDDAEALDGEMTADWVEDAAEEDAMAGLEPTETEREDTAASAEPEPVPEPKAEPEPEPEPQTPSTPPASLESPAFSETLARLRDRLGDVPPADRARLRAALVGLRDRVWADPPT
jgi:DNA-binding transcriptional MerR regulator